MHTLPYIGTHSMYPSAYVSISFMWHQWVKGMLFFFGVCVATPAAYRRSQARDRTHTTAVSRVTGVTMPDP